MAEGDFGVATEQDNGPPRELLHDFDLDTWDHVQGQQALDRLAVLGDFQHQTLFPLGCLSQLGGLDFLEDSLWGRDGAAVRARRGFPDHLLDTAGELVVQHMFKFTRHIVNIWKTIPEDIREQPLSQLVTTRYLDGVLPAMGGELHARPIILYEPLLLQLSEHLHHAGVLDLEVFGKPLDLNQPVVPSPKHIYGLEVLLLRGGEPREGGAGCMTYRVCQSLSNVLGSHNFYSFMNDPRPKPWRASWIRYQWFLR